MSALLGLSYFPDFTFVRLQILLKKYPLSGIWDLFTAQDLQQLGIKPQRIAKIIAFRKDFNVEKYQDRLQKENITAIDYYSAEYPALLKEIYDPPLVLYKKGVLPVSSGIAIVGTRYPTLYGCRSTENIIQALGKETIISGMAAGIDSIAHKAALKLQLPTIAVLGTPVNKCFPASNLELYNRLIKEGAILSEYPLDSKYNKWCFPRRNRIITGLSRATIVVEGTLTSGALISGKMALEQNRDVYALPGQLDNPVAEGPNWLISQGAKPIYNLEQFCFEISGEQLNLSFPKPIYTLNKDENKIYEQIPAAGSINIDTLLEQFELGFVSKTLLQMELKGMISILPGKQIARI